VRVPDAIRHPSAGAGAACRGGLQNARVCTLRHRVVSLFYAAAGRTPRERLVPRQEFVQGLGMAVIDLKGKIALVTGSARRVGKAIALELARQGMNLVVHHSASDREADETAVAIRALGV